MAIEFLILAAGLLLILFGANYLVDGASSIAKKSGLSEFVIGLTIVGIGTSTPEMVVSFISAFQGKTDMAIGNIIGSNIFNTLLILGITALIAPLTITKSNLKRDIPLNLFVTVLLLVLGMNHTLFHYGNDVLGRVDGIIMLGLFAWYLWSSFKTTPTKGDAEDSEGTKEKSILLSTVMIGGGLAGLIFGGRLFVNSASSIASMFGVSDKFIAITVMAAGTSMPELATSAVAAFKGRGQLALGNILGSNVSNILLILGGSALIRPLPLSNISYLDLGMVLLSAVLIMLTALTFKKNRIDRLEAVIFLLIEAAYMWYLIATL